MKVFFILITLLLFNILAIAQTDSLEQKLTQYKKLFESGLITEKEYEEVKAKALEIPVSRKEEINTKTQTLIITEPKELIELKSQYRDNYGFAIFSGCVGSMLIISSIIIKESDIPNPKRDNLSLSLGTVGGVFGLVCITNIILGGKNVKKYLAKKEQLGVSLNPHGIGLCYTFK